MKKITLLYIFMVAFAAQAMAFTTFGHQTIASIATKHLTEKAQTDVKAILGTDMVQECVWLNTLRTKPELAYTKDWHIFTLDRAGRSTTTAENDGIVQLEKAIAVLRDRANKSDSLVKASLKTVIHLVGDMHCISHIRIDGVEASKGFKFKLHNTLVGKSYKEWDTSWEAMWQRGFSERNVILSPSYYGADVEIFLGSKKTEYEKGTPRFWVENVGQDVVFGLGVFSPNALISAEDKERMEDIHNRCMAKAGYRLAALLNDIFK